MAIQIRNWLIYAGQWRWEISRHEEPGYSKTVKLRFLSQAEEEAIKEFTPRQRVEILLEALKSRKPNKRMNAEYLAAPVSEVELAEETN